MSKSKNTANKNTSEYDKLLKQVHGNVEGYARSYIPKMYNALKKEGLDTLSARDRIEKDLADVVSMTTIRKYLPEEAKQTNKARENLRNPLRKRAEEDSETIIQEEKPMEIAVATTGTDEYPSDIGKEDQITMTLRPNDNNANTNANTTVTTTVKEMKGVPEPQAGKIRIAWKFIAGMNHRLKQTEGKGKEPTLTHDGKQVTGVSY